MGGWTCLEVSVCGDEGDEGGGGNGFLESLDAVCGSLLPTSDLHDAEILGYGKWSQEKDEKSLLY